jgi:hypothetical protein
MGLSFYQIAGVRLKNPIIPFNIIVNSDSRQPFIFHAGDAIYL